MASNTATKAALAYLSFKLTDALLSASTVPAEIPVIFRIRYYPPFGRERHLNGAAIDEKLLPRRVEIRS